MEITKRRREFLEKVKEIRDRSNQPVHHTQVAAELGISDWSAYDMLKLLEQQGFLSSQYLIGKKKLPGRPLIVFSLTQRASLILETFSRGMQLEDWHQLKKDILTEIIHLKEAGHGRIAEEIIKVSKVAREPLNYCASVLPLFLLYIREVSDRGREVLDWLIGTISPETRLLTLAGVTFSNLIDKVKDADLIREFSRRINEYQDYITQFTSHEKKLLVDFFSEVAEAIQL